MQSKTLLMKAPFASFLLLFIKFPRYAWCFIEHIKRQGPCHKGFIGQSKEHTVQNSLDIENVYYLVENHKQMDKTKILNKDVVTKGIFHFTMLE